MHTHTNIYILVIITYCMEEQIKIQAMGSVVWLHLKGFISYEEEKRILEAIEAE